MNAHKFVAEKGIDEAKRVLSGVPICSSAFNIINEIVIYYQMCDNWWWYNSAKKEYEMDYEKSMKIDLSELKQVVESVEIIEKHGGLFATKCQLDKGGMDFEWYGENGDFGFTDLEELEQAIADYELVESYKQEKCEVLDMVDVSPNCEVINETH